MLDQTTLTSLFLDYLNQNKFQKSPSELYEPIDYILSIGGKRLRPVLLLMSYQLFDNQVEKALPAAMAVEVFHNFSLLHDDIMDEAPLRRGKPTVHMKYNVNTGILSGDVMMIYAYEYLLKYSDPHLAKALITTFNQVAIEVCEGQQYDMNFETQKEVLLSSYLKMIELKTAALLGGAMKMGALIGDADEEDSKCLEAFGRNIGIAFQLQDDILDTFGDAKTFGKRIGGDIVQNKKTFLVLKTLEVADANTRDSLYQLMSKNQGDEQKKIDKVTQLFKDVGVKELAEQKKEEYLEIAFENLTKVKVAEEKKQWLKGLSDKLMTRVV